MGSEVGLFVCLFPLKHHLQPLTEIMWKDGKSRGFGIPSWPLINWVTFDKTVDSYDAPLLSGVLVVCQAPRGAL